MTRTTAIAALLLALAPTARAGGARDVERQVRELVDGLARPGDAARVSEGLVALGEPALAPLLEHVARLQGVGGDEAASRGSILAIALASFPRADVLPFLTRVARSEAGEVHRAAALDVLGRIGRAHDLPLALELVTPPGLHVTPGPALREAFEDAFLGIRVRDTAAARVIAGLYPAARPFVQAAVVAALGRTGERASLGTLAGLLGRGAPGSDMLVMRELGRLAATTGGTDDVLVIERVRGVLGNPDKRLATLACVALLELRDHEAVPDLIVMLGDRDANLRERAHAALVGLTGFDLGGAPRPWIRWLDESFAWWDGRAPECRVAILSGTPEECARALRETAGQRLFADEVARMLALGLQRPEPDLFASACRALGGLPEHDARVALRRGALHAEPELARHALAALERQDARLARAARPAREPRAHAMPRMRTR